jgi:hypothetical protein
MQRRKWDAKTKALIVLEGLKGKPVADSITRPSWRNVVGSTHWLKQAKRIIISGMGGGSLYVDSDWGIHSLHGIEPPYLITSFGEGIV